MSAPGGSGQAKNGDLAQLRDDLFGLVALPCHYSPPGCQRHTSSRTTSMGADHASVRNQPSHRTLRYMVPDFTIALAIWLVIGFILGYGLRAIISYRRRQRARRRSYLF